MPRGPWLAKGCRVPVQDLELEVAGSTGHCRALPVAGMLYWDRAAPTALPWDWVSSCLPLAACLPACLSSRDALRPCRDPTPNPEAALLAPLACKDAGQLYISLLDPWGALMLLAQVPLPHPQSHSTDVPQIVVERRDTRGYDFACKS